MAGTLKDWGFSLAMKFLEIVGVDKCIRQEATSAFYNSSGRSDENVELSPVEEILAREFHSNGDVKKALVDLSEIKTLGAAEAIIDLMNSPRPKGYGFPLANGELVMFAASCIKKTEMPAFYLGKLIHVETEWYENRNAARYALEKSRLENNTHERKLIDEIVKIGGQDANEALNIWVNDHYPAQTQVALRKLALPDNMILFEDLKQS